MNKFLVIIEETESGFSSYSADLDGCIATGRTKKEVEENMYEAIRFHIEGLRAEGLEIPAARTESEVMVFA
jgi:predicted RNase H-like HicB family nuclease